MTWLDWYVQANAGTVREWFRARGWSLTLTSDGSPNVVAGLSTVLAMDILEYSANPEAHAASHGDRLRAYQSVLLAGCILPFVNGFNPVNRRDDALVVGPGLGLILKRETADMLANASPPASDPWRQRVFGAKPAGAGLGGVYVDIPRGALRLGKKHQVRALFSTPWRALADETDEDSGVVQTGGVLVAVVATSLESEDPVGLWFAVVDEEDRIRIVALPDNTLTGFLAVAGEELSEVVGSETMATFRLMYERTVDFLRLVLAYRHFGPPEAQGKLGITSAAKFVRNRNRPREGESIFAMVRLAAPSDRLGRTPSQEQNAGWMLTRRQDVAGHFKLQPCGPKNTLRQLIWVEGYARAPEDAVVKPRGVRA
nr:hypothetical protein [uncultured Rhodopila sp.]